LNKAFARAKGNYLGWLCADDTLLPGAISRLVDALEPDPELVIAYGDAIYTDERSDRKHMGRSGPWDPERMVREAQVPNKQPASLYTRRGWELAGLLDEDAWYYLDFQLTVRLTGFGRGVHVPEPLATYRIHAEGKSTGAPARKAADAVRCAQRFMRSDEVPPALRPLARREGRASLYRIAGANYYAALQLGRARSAYLRALVLSPRRVLLRRVAKCFLPRPVVRRLRARRVASVAMGAHGPARG
jgi:glycosyltransferase involved in cell wall biosynthesis